MARASRSAVKFCELASLELYKRYLERIERFRLTHPRALPAILLSLLGGFAATAFGIAPLAPDAADLPRRLVTEQVVPANIDQQLEALAAHELELARADLTRSTDTAESLLKRLGVADPAAAAFLRTDPVARRVLQGREGKMIRVRAESDGSLLELVARYPAERAEQADTHFTRLSMTRVGERWQARIEVAPLTPDVRIGSGTVNTTLFAATDEAGIPDGVSTQLTEIFATEIDFHRELRVGDTFSVVYEALTADGEPVTWNQSAGRVLAAEFVNNGRAHQAMWFASGKGRGNYFGFNGQSKQRGFLASPVQFSRVTSGFAMRFHPIMQDWRAHHGVDYGAPSGTPVRSVGEGVVDFAGWRNGYGNVVEIQHAKSRSTLYAHLSRMDVRKGQRIEQGQRIGAVGATGWATGPHLHFEFHVNGQFQDPLSIARNAEPVTVDAASRVRFAELAQGIRAKLEIADSMIGVRQQAE